MFCSKAGPGAGFGVPMLQTIGYVYGRQDAKELGKSVYSLGVPFAAEWFRSKAHSIEIHVTDDSGFTLQI